MYHMNKKQEANAFVKECITQALVEMIQKEPFENITITDITKRAGVGRVSFYRNFESKEDVLRQMVLSIIREVSESIPSSDDFSVVETVLRKYRERQDVFIALHNAGLGHISMSCLKDAYGPKAEQENQEAYRNAFLFYGIYGMIEEWFKRGTKEDPFDLVQVLLGLKEEEL